MRTIKLKLIGYAKPFDENEIVKIIKKKHNVEESENPDYAIFYSAVPEFYKYNCVRIHVLGENIVPNFNLCDYAIGFHYITYEDRYYRRPLYFFYEKDLELAMHKHERVDADLKRKKFCAMVASGTDCYPQRWEFYEFLSQNYKVVDSGGRWNNNVGGPVADKRNFLSDYKFNIAFENSKTNGYTTEKIVEAWAANTIPIYWGGEKVAQEFNPKAFINANDYDDYTQLVEKIKEIDQDDEKYLEMMKEPIWEDEEFFEKERKHFEQFIFNIFDQEPHDAIRRTNKDYSYGRIIELREKEYNLMKKSKIIQIADKINHQIFKKDNVWKR